MAPNVPIRGRCQHDCELSEAFKKEMTRLTIFSEVGSRWVNKQTSGVDVTPHSVALEPIHYNQTCKINFLWRDVQCDCVQLQVGDYISASLNLSNFCSTSHSHSLTSFRVVAITTLDGNKQHRPLMLSFILSSNNNQWTIIFDIFHRIVRDLDTEMHVVTSDQEKAVYRWRWCGNGISG